MLWFISNIYAKINNTAILRFSNNSFSLRVNEFKPCHCKHHYKKLKNNNSNTLQA